MAANTKQQQQQQDEEFDDLGISSLAIPAIFGKVVTRAAMADSPSVSSDPPAPAPVGVPVNEEFFDWFSHITEMKDEACRTYEKMCRVWNTKEEATTSTTTTTSSKDVRLDGDRIRIGPILTQKQRQLNTLGPLGGGQWSGQHNEKYPHSLLILNDGAMNSVEDWIQSLPRTCRQTMRKVTDNQHDWNCTIRVIDDPDESSSSSPAPHSTCEHFRCVLQHQIRLATAGIGDEDDENARGDQYYESVFINAVLEGIERYQLSIEECGSILEYYYHSDDDDDRSIHNNNNNEYDDEDHIENDSHEKEQTRRRVAAFCHLVGKGKTIRGQWFYATNEAASTAAKSNNLIWFHAVYTLVDKAFQIRQQQQQQQQQQQHVEEAAAEVIINVVDLGPNGVDGQHQQHAKLKERYGFRLYEDWPQIADYRGDYWTIQ